MVSGNVGKCANKYCDPSSAPEEIAGAMNIKPTINAMNAPTRPLFSFFIEVRSFYAHI
jgi:hypothetical protein